MKNVYILILPFLLLMACGDSSTNSGSGDQSPTIPNISESQVQFDYFRGKMAPYTIESNSVGYQIASTLTVTIESLIAGFTMLPASFMETANGEQASFSDGTWTWEYTAAGAGASVSVVLNATPRPLVTNWEMLISATTEEQSFSDYKFIDGSVSNTENSGTWNFYEFNEQSSSPVMTYEWDIDSEDDIEITITFGDYDFSTMTYTRSSPDNTITLSDNGDQTIIYWNTDTGSGYYEATDEPRFCWDENRAEATCP